MTVMPKWLYNNLKMVVAVSVPTIDKRKRIPQKAIDQVVSQIVENFKPQQDYFVRLVCAWKTASRERCGYIGDDGHAAQRSATNATPINPRVKFDTWVEKAIFIFWQACPGMVVETEHVSCICVADSGTCCC